MRSLYDISACMTEHRHEVLQIQRDSSIAKSAGEIVALKAAGTCRAVALVRLGSPVHGKALDVVCRTSVELDQLEALWNVEVQGVDLFSTDDRIVVADMGSMPFDDAQFQAVVSCHSLEHSFDPFEALAEFARVLAPKGQLFIEIPCQPNRLGVVTRYPSGADRWNFGSLGTLKAALPKSLTPVNWKDHGAILQLVAVKS